MNNDALVLKMILDESGFTSGMNSAVRKLDEFDGHVDNTGKKGGSSLGGIWTSFVGNFLASGAMKLVSAGINLVTDSISGAIARVDTLNNSTRVFQNMGFQSKETARTMDALKESIQGLPTPLDSAVKGVQLIASSTNDLGKSQEIFAALNNGILGFGGSTEMVDNAIIQLSQSFSNGKVDAQTWNSMINSGLGPALNALAKQMGMTAGEMKEGLSDGTISVEQFQDALIDLNKNGGGGLKSLETIAQDATAGIGTGIENMKTAVTRGMANVITSIDESLKEAGFDGIGGIIANIGSTFESALNKIAGSIPRIISVVTNLYTTFKPFLPLLTGVIAGVGSFIAITKTISTVTSIVRTTQEIFAGFKAVITGVKLATDAAANSQKIYNAIMSINPYVAIAAAIIGVVALVTHLWKTNEGFRDAVIDIWDSIKKAFSDAADWVLNAWTGTKEFFSDLWSGIKESASTAYKGVQDAWSNTKDWFKQKGSDISDGIKSGWGATTDWFSGKWEDISSAAQTAIDFIWHYIGPFVEGYKDAFDTLFRHTEGIWVNIQQVAGSAWEIIKNIVLAPVLAITSFVTGGFEEMQTNMLAVWENIKLHALSIWVAIQRIFTSYVTGIVSMVTSIWTGFKESISNIWTGLSTTASNIWDGMKTAASNKWQEIKSTATQKATQLKNDAQSTWDNLKTNTSNTWEKLKKDTSGKWNDIKTSTVGTADKLVSGAQNAWSNLKQNTSDTIDKVKGFFNKLRDIDLFEIGKNIIQGLKDGIDEKIDSVKNTISDLAEGIKGKIKNALNIHSPSRWMRDMIGHNIVAGIVAGIVENASMVYDSMNALADETMAIQPEFVKVAVSDQSDRETTKTDRTPTVVEKTGDTFNIYLQTMGDLPESQLMTMAKKLVYYIEQVRNDDELAVGGGA